MSNFRALLGILALILGSPILVSCQKAWPGSDLKVTNGTEVGADEYQEVIELSVGGGLCTGTFIGDNTVITAAHCVSGLAPTGARLGFRGAQSIDIMVNPRYAGGVGASDLALVLFPANTASSWKALSSTPPAPGDAITIVGYGKYDHFNDATAGTKRKGTNTLRRRTAGELHFQGETGPTGGETGRNVASSNGDSGGPMFIADAVVGVTSGGFAAQGVKYSVYVDLQYPANRAFLEQATSNGARIPSLTEQDDTPPDDVIPPGTNNDLFLALGAASSAAADSYGLFIAADDNVSRVVFCYADQPTLCNTGEDSTVASYELTLGERKIYKADAALAEGKTLHVIAYNADDIASVRRFSFESL